MGILHGNAFLHDEKITLCQKRAPCLMRKQANFWVHSKTNLWFQLEYTLVNMFGKPPVESILWYTFMTFKSLSKIPCDFPPSPQQNHLVLPQKNVKNSTENWKLNKKALLQKQVCPCCYWIIEVWWVLAKRHCTYKLHLPGKLI